MKKISLIAASLMLSIQALGAVQTETKTVNVLLPVNDLKCVIVPSGDLATRLQYTSLDLAFYYINSASSLSTDHNLATVNGCDLAALDQIVKQASYRFGFVDTAIKVVKEVEYFKSVALGTCREVTTETIDIDLGYGVVLKSRVANNVASNSCP